MRAQRGVRTALLLTCAGLSVWGAWAAEDAWTAEFTAAARSLRKKDYGAAEAGFRRALSLAEGAGEAQRDRVITSLNSLGVVSSAQGRTLDAERYYEQAVRVTRLKFGREHPNTTSPLLNLGIARAANHKLRDAEGAFEEAWQNAGADGRDDLRAALLLYHRGNVRRQLKKFQSAEQDLTRSLFIRERRSRDPGEVGRTLFALATVYMESGRRDLEEALWRRYVTLRDRSLDKWDNDNIVALRNYAAVLRRNGKADAADLAERKAALGAQTLEKQAR